MHQEHWSTDWASLWKKAMDSVAGEFDFVATHSYASNVLSSLNCSLPLRCSDRPTKKGREDWRRREDRLTLACDHGRMNRRGSNGTLPMKRPRGKSWRNSSQMLCDRRVFSVSRIVVPFCLAYYHFQFIQWSSKITSYVLFNHFFQLAD